MFDTQARQQPPQVTALFDDGVHSFQLSEGATVAELAERLEVLCAWHTSPPLAVHVQLDQRSRNH